MPTVRQRFERIAERDHPRERAPHEPERARRSKSANSARVDRSHPRREDVRRPRRALARKAGPPTVDLAPSGRSHHCGAARCRCPGTSTAHRDRRVAERRWAGRTGPGNTPGTSAPPAHRIRRTRGAQPDRGASAWMQSLPGPTDRHPRPTSAGQNRHCFHSGQSGDLAPVPVADRIGIVEGEHGPCIGHVLRFRRGIDRQHRSGQIA